MPELPEVELARRDLERWWSGQVIEAVEVLDDEVARQGDPRALAGRAVAAVRRRGKFLIIALEPALACVLHLRMTGKVVPLERAQDRLGRARLVWRLQRGDAYALLDTRRLGHVDVVAPSQLDTLGVLGRMGPEPWPTPLSAPALRAIFSHTRRPIKAALLEQERIAGVGNIVAAEALWLAQIDPRAPACALSEPALAALGDALWRVCERTLALEADREIQYLHDPASRGAENPFFIYGQPRCPRCEQASTTLQQAGRATWLCAACQTRS